MQKHYYIFVYHILAFLSISYQYHIIITFKAQQYLKIAYIVHCTVVM